MERAESLPVSRAFPNTTLPNPARRLTKTATHFRSKVAAQFVPGPLRLPNESRFLSHVQQLAPALGWRRSRKLAAIPDKRPTPPKNRRTGYTALQRQTAHPAL